MGSNSSKYTKKAGSSCNSSEECVEEHSASVVTSQSTVFVLSRKGTYCYCWRKCLTDCLCRSMYIDEDGDLAHEFYVEVPPPKKGCKATMKRILHNLIPQGEVAYKFPRLHVDFPIILHHV